MIIDYSDFMCFVGICIGAFSTWFVMKHIGYKREEKK